MKSVSEEIKNDDAEYKPDYEIDINDGHLFYKGPISKSSIDHLFKKIKQQKITSMTVNSPGGTTGAAMDFAEWMKVRDISLVIEGNCFSSCANYFLPAASSVLVKTGSIVGWHGGALQKKWRYNYPWYLYVFPLMIATNYFNTRDEWKEREANFYRDVDVSKYISVIGQSEKYAAPNKDLYYSGWNYDIKTLNLLGINNITIEDGELYNEEIDSNIPVWQLSLTKEQIENFEF